MSIRKLLGKLLLFGVLEVGALTGAMRPEEIEKIMQVMHSTKVEHVVKNENSEE